MSSHSVLVRSYSSVIRAQARADSPSGSVSVLYTPTTTTTLTMIPVLCRMSNNMAKIADARKTVEQLKLEVNIERMLISKAAAELMAYCESHAKEDPLSLWLPFPLWAWGPCPGPEVQWVGPSPWSRSERQVLSVETAHISESCHGLHSFLPFEIGRQNKAWKWPTLEDMRSQGPSSFSWECG
uniref:Guanine nucleotide-binding protein subunit gamma n=1 Tax=Knipowitschia caucasica TaxID=637954 RepID=A0AAV2JBF6_KNICA